MKILILSLGIAILWQGCAASDSSINEFNVEVQSERITFLDPSIPEMP